MADKLVLQNQILSELKRLHLNIGRVPTRADVVTQSPVTKHQIDVAFGTFTEALKAAGLDPKSQRQSAIRRVNQVFTGNINDLVSRTSRPQKGIEDLIGFGEWPESLYAGDLHAPFWNEDAVQKFIVLVERLAPTLKYIFQVGDAFDFWSFARFARSHLIIRPDEELRLGRKMMEHFWEQVRTAAPKARLIQLLGNHDIRPMKKLIESSAPELEAFIDIKKWFEFDGVETFHDPREPYMLKDVAVHHGHLSPLGAHRINLGHNIHGHTHRGGYVESKINGRFLFELDCGYLGDQSKKAFNYTPVKENAWSLGGGFLGRFSGAFIPF